MMTAGQGLFVAYHPPDQHLSQFIVASCQKVALATGGHLFVIDRAVNSLALARAFDHQDFGLLCMLDDNEHHGLESFEATLEETRKDGTKVQQYFTPCPDSHHDTLRLHGASVQGEVAFSRCISSYCTNGSAPFHLFFTSLSSLHL